MITDDYKKKVWAVIREMADQNDRGAAIVGGVLLEEATAQLIQSLWPPISNAVRDRIFTGYGPLASFSAKIDISHAMGAISNNIRLDLGIVKAIRNRAAHMGLVFEFRSPEVKLLIDRFSVALNIGAQPARESDYPERQLFQCAIENLSARLDSNAVVFHFYGLSYGHELVATMAEQIEETIISSV